MGFRCGIVGLPNVGKSTLFNALLGKQKAHAANFPFCTIEPNVGKVPVPDRRLDQLARIVHPERIVPTQMEFVDIAGLVKGASQGEGLGNQFLGKIQEVEAIVHVVRCFEDPEVIHVAGSIDPVRDIEIINTELMLKDLESVQTVMQRLEKQARGAAEADAQAAFGLVQRVYRHLADGKVARAIEFSPTERPIWVTTGLNLLSAKNVIYAANVDEAGLKHLPAAVLAVQAYADQHGAQAIVVCAKMEAELSELGPEEAAEYLQHAGVTESGLNQLIHRGYALLGLITFFTAGPKEVRAWTIPQGYRAPAAAGKIHSDFERGFIRAEVISYQDYVRLGGEGPARENGVLRVEGKEYIVQDGDVVHFRFSV